MWEGSSRLGSHSLGGTQGDMCLHVFSWDWPETGFCFFFDQGVRSTHVKLGGNIQVGNFLETFDDVSPLESLRIEMKRFAIVTSQWVFETEACPKCTKCTRCTMEIGNIVNVNVTCSSHFLIIFHPSYLFREVFSDVCPFPSSSTPCWLFFALSFLTKR